MKNKIIITVLVILSLVTPQISSAFVPFGGRIVMMHECYCSGGWMVYVSNAGTGVTTPLLFQFGISTLKANWNIFTYGVNVLGTYTPGGVCIMATFECAGGPSPVGTISTIPGVGTSLSP